MRYRIVLYKYLPYLMRYRIVLYKYLPYLMRYRIVLYKYLPYLMRYRIVAGIHRIHELKNTEISFVRNKQTKYRN